MKRSEIPKLVILAISVDISIEIFAFAGQGGYIFHGWLLKNTGDY
jgi:hypothetical protein